MDLEKEDWIDINRKSKWHSSLRNNQIEKFLGIESKNCTRVRKDYCVKYYKNIICVSFEKFLKQCGYTIVKKFAVSERDFRAIQKEDIEISQNNFKRYITDGFFFLEGKDHRLVLDMDDVYRREEEWAMELFCDISDESKALDFLIKLETFAKDNSYLKGAKIDPSLNFIPMDKSYTWDDVILPEAIKKEIRLNVDNLLDKLDIYKKNNIVFKRGLILTGIPGTGKTLIGKIICRVANCTFLWVTPKSLGLTRNIASICKLARELAPTVLFLEDIDLYGGHRESNAGTAFLGELMNQLDGLIENEYIIVIATTNKADKVEDALKNRPGRFDRILDLPKPNTEGRLKMLTLYLSKYNVEKLNLEKVSKETTGYTGAHVKELVNTAMIEAIDTGSLTAEDMIILKQEHFTNNIEKVRTKTIVPIGFKQNLAPGVLAVAEPIEPDDF